MAPAQRDKQTKKKRGQSGDRRNIWLLVVMTLLVVGSVFMFTPPQEKINQGLDIQGGLSVVLTAKSDTGGAVAPEDIEKSRAIIESRVNALGASEATVQVQGNDQILVQIPGLSDTQEALNTIGKTGQLEFARLDSFTDKETKEKIEKGQYANEGTVTDAMGNTLPSGKEEHLAVKPGTYAPIVTGSNITRVNIDKENETSSNYAVNIELDAAGTEAFATASRELVGNKGKIVIILDGEVQSAPAVQSEITGGKVAITGGYTIDEAKNLQTVLESGSLPVSFEYAQSQTVGPTLGQDALRSGVLVAGIGLLLVMLYLLFFYRGLGLLTAAAMGVFAILYLGILATLSHFGLFSLSLAGIAGIVLTIGMAADSSILTLERFREEIRMGRSVRAASITGVRHAIQTSIDADLVTLVSALSLFFLASASVKGFGLTLAIGIACDIIMMLIFKAPLIRLLAPRSIQKHPGFWGTRDSLAAADSYKALAEAEGQSVAAAEMGEEVNAEKSESIAEKKAGSEAAGAASAAARKPRGKFIKHDINFLGYRKVFLTVAAVLVVASFAVVGVKGMTFGIEFVGGTSVAFHGTGDITTDQLRTAFDKAGESDAVIQTTNADGQEGFLVRTTTTSAEDATAHAKQVADSLGLSTETFEVTTIGPDWGAGVIQSSLIAFLVSLILIIIYIALRFEYKMGVTAIVALLHDLVLVMGIYALVGREVNPNTIAALLTILGYSLYDTVVVFHRINDNMKETDIKCTFMTMANHSINQVLIRTINTTLSSLIPVAAMLFFGGATLQDFAFAMTIGLVCGSYSSVAVATPLYAIWKSHEPKNAKLVKKYGNEVGRFDFAHPSVSAPVAAAVKPVAAQGAQASSAAAKPKAKVKQQPHPTYKRKKTAAEKPVKASQAQPEIPVIPVVPATKPVKESAVEAVPAPKPAAEAAPDVAVEAEETAENAEKE
ncbi:MAG: protein translocase subunit SecD [Raoultibacter sp.]